MAGVAEPSHHVKHINIKAGLESKPTLLANTQHAPSKTKGHYHKGSDIDVFNRPLGLGSVQMNTSKGSRMS